MPLVRRATWKHGLSKEDARDVVQEAFLLAMVKLRDDGNPRAWLAQVVDNLSKNHRRKTLRRKQLTAKWAERRSVEAGDPSATDSPGDFE